MRRRGLRRRPFRFCVALVAVATSLGSRCCDATVRLQNTNTNTNAITNFEANTVVNVGTNTNAATARASSLAVSPLPAPSSSSSSSSGSDWASGAVLEGYELVERTALLGVCNHHVPTNPPRRRRIGVGVGSSGVGSSGVGIGSRQVAVVEFAVPRDVDDDDEVNENSRMFPVVRVGRNGQWTPTLGDDETESLDDDDDTDEPTAHGVVPDGPSLEYQCLLDDIDLVYVNRNYRLKKKFAAGSHGEVWRATRRRPQSDGSGGSDGRGSATTDAFILKRLFVERGDRMVEMGLREAHFGKLLAHEPHVARFVEFFFRGGATASSGSDTDTDTTNPTAGSSAHVPFTTAVDPAAYAAAVAPSSPRPLRTATASGTATAATARLPVNAMPPPVPPPQPETIPSPPPQLWLVFHDEGISLRHYLYASRASTHSAVLFEPSPFWHKLRSDAHGEDVLREILRQLLEGVAALHDRGVTHRDIKPSNILVHLEHHDDDTDNDSSLTIPIVKLADFGSAVDDHTFQHLYGERGPTQAEETREYQAPEVLFSDVGVPYDFAYPLAYDMWSVGVVFLEMVLGSPQVFMISPRARAKLDAKLRGKDDASRRQTYLLHVFTHEFCIYQPSPHELQRLWTQHALVSDSCHFGRFNTTIIERDPLRTGLRNPWALDLMWKLLQWNPSQRISARAALAHAFFKGPYVCRASGRQFATHRELATHEAYLASQRAREQDMAFVVREKYALPSTFKCPHCHRTFATIASCEQHLVARKHDVAAKTHFCDHEKERLRAAIAHDSVPFTQAPGRSVGAALLQGKKKYMEDFAVVHRDDRLNVSVYAVIDGHLGTRAAEYVRTHVASMLLDGLERLNLTIKHDDTNERAVLERVLMRQVFLELQRGFIETLAPDAPDFSGCTLTVVVHFEDQDRLLSANVGDSRAIVVSGPESVPLSMDHWPNDVDERQRIESSGGFVAFEGLWRVVGQLAVSRSIGDWHLRQYVTAEPSIFTWRLADHPYGRVVLVVASDGVWDTMANHDVAHFLTDTGGTRHLQDVAVDLVQEAFLRGSLDNLAAVLVDVTPRTTHH